MGIRIIHVSELGLGGPRAAQDSLWDRLDDAIACAEHVQADLFILSDVLDGGVLSAPDLEWLRARMAMMRVARVQPVILPGPEDAPLLTAIDRKKTLVCDQLALYGLTSARVRFIVVGAVPGTRPPVEMPQIYVTENQRYELEALAWTARVEAMDRMRDQEYPDTPSLLLLWGEVEGAQRPDLTIAQLGDPDTLPISVIGGGWDYVALSGIGRHQDLGAAASYPGPLCGQEGGWLQIDIVEGRAVHQFFERFRGKRVRRKPGRPLPMGGDHAGVAGVTFHNPLSALDGTIEREGLETETHLPFLIESAAFLAKKGLGKGEGGKRDDDMA